ncbi:MAG: hydrogenase formation protein HypD [Thiobacillus sp. 65-69]|nr:hydrogenase formation protein HypD [Thiobacillus sp.]ODU89489.1 MAG: hydrogenase formation protein HypD [Thiobacillus sp. SCN 65-179]OJW37418.1 MAG: hydrogenase formation protein HypD [Thiobacillus sp. 65-69]
MDDAHHWLEKLRALEFDRTVKIMNVCGGHERSITHAGLRGVLPAWIELVPGPGCPVCVCPEEDVYQAIQLALQDQVILVAFGDMLRVPVNVKKGEVRSLAEAQAAGADVRPVASPLDARHIAQANPGRAVVFFAAGFETTTAPVAAMLAEGIPDNLSVLLSGRLTWPAVAMLLGSFESSPGKPGFDALVAPGHVSAVMGPEEWRFVVDRHEIPAAVAGFSTESLLAAFYSVLRQLKTGERFLDNCYREVAHPEGNATAQRFLRETLDVVDANWRGIGVIPQSGYALKPALARHDARAQFPDHADPARRRAGDMPPGCDCAQVVLGKIYPNQCRIYGRACTPRTPVGPCMVSDEGACRIWWAGGVRVAADA